MFFSATTLLLAIYIFVQIISESFPVSSSAHVCIVEWLLHVDFQNVLPHYLDHLLHGPTLLILIVFFRRSWVQPLIALYKGLRRGKRVGSYSYATRHLLQIIMKSCWHLVLTTGLAIGVYVVIARVLKPCTWYAGAEMVLVGLLVTMVMLLSLYWEPRENDARLNWRTAILLGCVQAVALLPGISRFGSTYVTARFLRFVPRRAFEVSFLIQMPLIVIAFLIDGIGGMVKHPMPELNTFFMFGLMSVATCLAYRCFWLMWKLALTQRLWIMGFYMLVPISIVLYFLAK